MIDHATLSDAELGRYGLPQRLPGESLSHWKDIVRQATHRDCDLKPVYLDGKPKKSDTYITYGWDGVVAEPS